MRNQWVITVATIAAASAWALFSQPASAQVTVFSDDFSNGSTVNQPSTPGGTPPASYTSYDIASSKAATSTVSAADLDLYLPSTSSGHVQAQALFTTSPVTLANPGDYVDLTVAFTDTANILISGKLSSRLWIGLFNSGGVAPLTNLQTDGLTNNYTGGTQLWQGYEAQLAPGGNTTKTYLRPQQNAAAGDQDLLGNNSSSGTTYGNPAGAQLSGTTATSVILTNGQQLTEEFRVMLNATGGTTVSDILYDVSSSSVLLSVASTTNGIPITAFDGLAVGWQYKGSSGDPASVMDVSSVTVTTDVPEPSTLVLLGTALGWVIDLVVRRRK